MTRSFTTATDLKRVLSTFITLPELGGTVVMRDSTLSVVYTDESKKKKNIYKPGVSSCND